MAAAHFKKVERQLFDEDDDAKSDDEDVYDQYRGNEDDEITKKKDNTAFAKKSRSPPDAGNSRLNMSSITGKNNTGHSMIVGGQDSDGGSSLKQGLISKGQKPTKKYQNPSKK